MSTRLSIRRRPLALALAGLATAATLAVTTQSAEATTYVYCYTPSNAPVYLYKGGPWMYSVQAGRVFAADVNGTTYYNGEAYFYGHGNGQPNGYSPARYYSFCQG